MISKWNLKFRSHFTFWPSGVPGEQVRSVLFLFLISFFLSLLGPQVYEMISVGVGGWIEKRLMFYLADIWCSYLYSAH